jgi:AAA domain
MASVAQARRRFVAVAGPPGTGKTTLAEPLAVALGLPLLAKDMIKEALMDALGSPSTVDESRRLGGAAVRTLLAVAAASRGAVLESTFYPETVETLRTLPGCFVEVRCICSRTVALERYRQRAADRHAGHLDSLRTDDELWNPLLLAPLGLGPVVTVDTTDPVDVGSVAADVRRRFDEQHPGS